MQSIGDGVITTDNEGRVVLFNLVAQNLTGWSQSEAHGRMLEEVFHIVNEHTGSIVENPVKKVLETGLIRGLANNTVLIAKDGTTYIITDSAAPIHNPTTDQIIGVVFVFRDITLQKQLEQEMYKAQKLESIGILAGGIAHDFNNILTVLTSNLWLARAELQHVKLSNSQTENTIITPPPPLSPTPTMLPPIPTTPLPTVGETDELKKTKNEAVYTSVQELLAEAETAAFQAKDLTGQLITFAKGGVPLKQTISPKTLLEETVRFTLRGSKVGVVFELPEDLWWIEADPNQLGQVITNLVINAEQAMPGGGILKIGAENISAEMTNQQIQLLAVPLKSLDYVKLSLADQGVGIPEQILPKIFDPYFSTKQKGSGLGLATSYSIITRHEGVLRALSEMGKGTTFLIYLPAIRSSDQSSPPATNSLALSNVKSHKERLLIMDDEKPILTILKRILTNVGYTVDTAIKGETTIELYRKALEEEQPYSAVVLDLTIGGGLGGIQTLAYLQKIDPQVRAIVMSGYYDNAVLSQYQEYGFKSAVSKPFQVKKLYQIIENVLGSVVS